MTGGRRRSSASGCLPAYGGAGEQERWGTRPADHRLDGRRRGRLAPVREPSTGPRSAPAVRPGLGLLAAGGPPLRRLPERHRAPSPGPRRPRPGRPSGRPLLRRAARGRHVVGRRRRPLGRASATAAGAPRPRSAGVASRRPPHGRGSVGAASATPSLDGCRLGAAGRPVTMVVAGAASASGAGPASGVAFDLRVRGFGPAAGDSRRRARWPRRSRRPSRPPPAARRGPPRCIWARSIASSSSGTSLHGSLETAAGPGRAPVVPARPRSPRPSRLLAPPPPPWPLPLPLPRAGHDRRRPGSGRFRRPRRVRSARAR